MAVYGERRRRTTPIVLAGALVVLLALLGGWAWLRLRPGPGPEEARRRVQQETQRMLEGLDVLTVSHYTEEVVQGGRVLLPEEYQAARENLQEIRRRFEVIRSYLPPQQADRVDAALTELEALVKAKRPAAEVQQQAERLMGLLTEVGR